ncbi:hypothetical protein CHUAL_004938 [Chamberlinius hualienensis]
MCLNYQVRGAPAIAIVASLSLAVEVQTRLPEDVSDKPSLASFVSISMERLLSARPTAFNILNASLEIESVVCELIESPEINLEQMKERLVSFLVAMLENDINHNQSIGAFGAARIKESGTKLPVRILTHCNTGSLATAGYGTALGVVRSLHQDGSLEHCYFTETRPYNQGSRLTAYELIHGNIPSTLICDSMVSWVMKNKDVSAVVVGADRIAGNGDTANKIGTYQLAIAAAYHSVPFYVAAPIASIDFSLKDGSNITIEERPAVELTSIGGHRVAAEGVNCWNPAFDITPAKLITGGIITERGVYSPEDLINAPKMD